jgi:poly(glycerol-phosphate) alpha-glucosyltransferase
MEEGIAMSTSERLPKLGANATGHTPELPVLPQGYHCAVTWGIPNDFGGMTSALLRRSRAFVREAGVHVDVLTFEYDAFYEEVRCELEVAGELIAGMRLRNLWEELASLSADVLRSARSGRAVVGQFVPLSAPDAYTEDLAPHSIGRRTRYDASGKTALQVDYLRPDGSIYVSDQRDIDSPGVEGKRLVTLCGYGGEPIASWNQMWPLYLFWLDTVVESRETFMIVDSKSTANFITRYRRDNVVTLHLVHNSHMAAGQLPPHGQLSSVRRYVFERLSSYDGIVLLTRKQKRDVDEVYSPGNTFVVPNSTELPDLSLADGARAQRHGVMLASLTGRKQIDHAILAIRDANAVATEPFILTIYGQGPERAALESLIAESDLVDHVSLAGYVDNPREQLESASFVLLTSKAEGLPLVILEALSVGCLPIAYDMPYGPGDTIIDGVNGYLVAAGDIAAATERILSLGELGPEEVEEMRRRARSTAEGFSDQAVTATWGEVMRAATEAKLRAIVDRLTRSDSVRS